jgi:glycosyltransferase involved in cell wall biosynthesis
MKTLSICIPSLNRKTYLFQALRSILESPQHLDRLEICVSNNCSDEDYTDIENYLKLHPCAKYVRQMRRVSLDENMHSCVRAAVGTYVYYLGDDDYFLPGGLNELFSIIDRDHPDLVILDGLRVDAESLPLGRRFSSKSRIIRDFPTAYAYYNAKSVFGAILVKREYLTETLFTKFFGTSHAYACYWAALAMLHEGNQEFHLKVLAPENPIVAIRVAKKTYSDYILDVHYDHMARWYTTFLGFIRDGELKRTIGAAIDERKRLGLSLRFLCGLKLAGADVSKIWAYPGRWRSLVGSTNLMLVEVTPTVLLRLVQKIKGALRGA